MFDCKKGISVKLKLPALVKNHAVKRTGEYGYESQCNTPAALTSREECAQWKGDWMDPKAVLDTWATKRNAPLLSGNQAPVCS
jgi:hypothetical protein